MSAALNVSFNMKEFMAQRTYRRPQDSWLGFALAFAVHLALLFVGGMIFIKQAEFGVDAGISSVDVQLVATPSEPVVQPQEEIIKQEENAEAVPMPVEPKVEPVPQAQVVSSQGAISDVKPSYLKNPAPRYPIEARRNRWEGVVVLEVFVNAKGTVSRVNVKESSGHAVLDESALKTVQTWSFRPARLGAIEVESSVVVPVRFDLKDTNK